MILILKHVESEGPGTILDFLAGRNLNYKVLELWKKQALPRDLSGISHVVVMGGPMNVYEELKYQFLKEEDEFIKLVVDKEVPFLGICLGAQLLAKACGSKVYKASTEEIGWHDVEILHAGSNDRIFNGIGEKMKVFQWHGDTFEIPRNGVLLATGKTVENQAFKAGKCAYGLQFHIEINNKILKAWFADNLALQNEFIGYYNKIENEYNAIASEIYSKFFLKRYNQ